MLATGSGKTLIAMVGALLGGAGTTLVILPTVALGSDQLGRLRRAGIKTMEWFPNGTCQRKAKLVVLVTAEAACTDAFLEYAAWLDSEQQLDCIVVDECYLTLTASSYRQSMQQLGAFVRQVPMQTVWLMATMLPAFEEAFIS